MTVKFDFKNPNYTEVYRVRAERLNRLRAQPILLQAAKTYYKTHPVEFINDWVFTFNPKNKVSVIPFKLMPKQVEFIEWLYDLYIRQEEGIAEKCRDVGFSWLAIAFAVWLFLFDEGRTITFLSLKAEQVDKLGDMDTLLEKVRFILRKLPREFLPTGFNLQQDMGLMRILSTSNNNIIKGVSGDDPGRGGRSSIIFLDEGAHLERSEAVDAAVSENASCKIWISTPNGVGNAYYRKRMSGMYTVFTYHWYDDLRKDEAWLESRRMKLSPMNFAKEIMIDYSASIEDICIPMEWIRSAVKLDLPKEGIRQAGLDLSDGGADANALAIRHGSVLEWLDLWKEGMPRQSARKAYAICEKKSVELLCFDPIGIGADAKGEYIEMNTSDKKVTTKGINVARTDLKGSDESGKKNSDVYRNLKALLWWNLRRRFERTHEHVKGIRQYEAEDLISIPDDTDLIVELSSPKYFHTENGKIQIESKDRMRARGIKSPNKADACVLAFTPKDLCNTTIRMRII